MSAHYFLTVEETADLLRTTPQAIRARFRRGRLPGACKDGRRLLIRRQVLLDEIEASVPSPPPLSGEKA